MKYLKNTQIQDENKEFFESCRTFLASKSLCHVSKITDREVANYIISEFSTQSKAFFESKDFAKNNTKNLLIIEKAKHYQSNLKSSIDSQNLELASQKVEFSAHITDFQNFLNEL